MAEPKQSTLSPAVARNLAQQFSSLLGVNAQVVNEGVMLVPLALRSQHQAGNINVSERFSQTFIAIDIGDIRAADEAIDQLAAIRKRTGLTNEQFGFSLGADKNGQILIDATAAANAGPGLFTKLAPQRESLAAVIREASDIAKMPSIVKALDLPHGTFDYPEKGIVTNNKIDVIKSHHFQKASSQTSEIWRGGMELAKEIMDEASKRRVDPSKLKELRDVASLGGQDGKFTQEKLASYLIASSMSHAGHSAPSFTNFVDFRKPQSDPQAIKQTAEELYQNRPSAIAEREAQRDMPAAQPARPQGTPGEAPSPAHNKFRLPSAATPDGIYNKSKPTPQSLQQAMNSAVAIAGNAIKEYMGAPAQANPDPQVAANTRQLRAGQQKAIESANADAQQRMGTTPAQNAPSSPSSYVPPQMEMIRQTAANSPLIVGPGTTEEGMRKARQAAIDSNPYLRQQQSNGNAPTTAQQYSDLVRAQAGALSQASPNTPQGKMLGILGGAIGNAQPMPEKGPPTKDVKPYENEQKVFPGDGLKKQGQDAEFYVARYIEARQKLYPNNIVDLRRERAGNPELEEALTQYERYQDRNAKSAKPQPPTKDGELINKTLQAGERAVDPRIREAYQRGQQQPPVDNSRADQQPGHGLYGNTPKPQRGGPSGP